ncbi:bifunctional diaminohydroxyphosphoribosylaminopyrimidine deaminase/5-amino-6-(5-phosphoribosylamino)uracil reductase RibD, partial [candidate division KSB1 bacterium]
MKDDIFFLRRALKLAGKGKGNVSPNPMVGAVIVKNGEILGEGYHKNFGGNHAEINAIKNSISNPSNSTMYINLEPCCHYGKTPPCVNAIVKSGIKKVVICNKDPNPEVNGKGMDFLRKNGVEVVEGILKNEEFWFNRFYYKYIQKGIPYVIMKIAQTINSRIGRVNKNEKWITSLKSRKKVHSLRKEVDGILIGANTVIVDNPELTVRYVKGKNPLRIILDTFLETDLNYKVYKDNNVIIFTDKNA